jgi:hypothetical protein
MNHAGQTKGAKDDYPPLACPLCDRERKPRSLIDILPSLKEGDSLIKPRLA